MSNNGYLYGMATLCYILYVNVPLPLCFKWDHYCQFVPIKEAKSCDRGEAAGFLAQLTLGPTIYGQAMFNIRNMNTKKTSRTWNFMNGNIVQLSWYISQADFFRYLVLTKNIWIISLQSSWDIFALKLRFFLFSQHNISDIWDNL